MQISFLDFRGFIARAAAVMFQLLDPVQAGGNLRMVEKETRTFLPNTSSPAIVRASFSFTSVQVSSRIFVPVPL